MVKQQKMTEPMINQALRNSGVKLEFISGKWFINGIEYALIGKGGIYSRLGLSVPQLSDFSTLERFIKWFTVAENDLDGPWPEMPILTKAKQKIAEGYKPGKLAYPLSEKDLKVIHYLVDGDPKDTYAIFLYGVGNTGKTTFCKLVKQIFGAADTTEAPFNELGDKFGRSSLAGKRLWCDTEVSPYWPDSTSHTLKKVITHDYAQIEEKFQKPYTTQYRCKPLFACNTAPSFDITDTGLLRRILYFFKNVPFQNPDGNLVDKKYTEEELLDIVVAALLTDMTDWTKEFIKDTHEVIMSSNSVGKYGMTGTYTDYELRCANNRVHPFGMDKYNKLKELFMEWQTK